MSSADRLLSREKVHSKLYDVESMLDVNESVATGYIVLLKGRPRSPRGSSSSRTKSSRNKQYGSNGDDENLALAFMALTSGNVVDSCFGVQHPNLRDDTPGRRCAREAKSMLEESDTTDAFRRTAVGAYCEAFELVMEYHERMKELNCFTRCFKAKSIRREAAENIRTAFASLVIAIGEAN